MQQAIYDINHLGSQIGAFPERNEDSSRGIKCIDGTRILL
jgi:hypothetical protein